MANLKLRVVDDSTSPPTTAHLRLVDNGDGTYSLGTGQAQLPAALGPQTAAAALATTDTSATLYAGTLATSTSAAALAASQAVREVVVQNDPDSTTDILVGSSSAQTIQLRPGDALTIPVSNLATIYVKSVSGTPTLNYLGRS